MKKMEYKSIFLSCFSTALLILTTLIVLRSPMTSADVRNDQGLIYDIDWEVEKTITDHTDWTIDTCWSPCGQYLATSAANRVINIYYTSNWSKVASFSLGVRYLILDWSPDGDYIATGVTDSYSTNVTLIETTGWTIYKSWEAHDNEVSCVKFTSDGNYLLSSGDSVIRAWYTDNWTQKGTNMTTGSRVSKFDVSSDGVYAAAATWPVNNLVEVWAIGNNTRIASLSGVGYRPNVIEFTRDDKYLICGGETGNLYCWNTSDFSVVKSYSYGDQIRGLANHPFLDVTAVSFRDIAIRLFDNEDKSNWEQEAILTGHSWVYGYVKWSPDGKYLSSVSNDRTVIIYRLILDENVLWELKSSLSDFSDTPLEMDWSPDGKYFASSCKDGYMNVYYASNWTLFKRYQISSSTYGEPALKWSNDGRYIVVGNSSAGNGIINSVVVIDTSNWTIVKEFQSSPTSEYTYGLRFSKDGRYLITKSKDWLKFWYVRNWTYTGKSYYLDGSHCEPAISPNYMYIAYEDWETQSVVVQYLENGTTAATLTGLGYRPHSIGFTMDNEHIICGSDGGKIITWRTSDWTKVYELSGMGAVRDLRIHRSNNYAAFSIRDSGLRLYNISDITDWKEVASIDQSNGIFGRIEWSKNGSFLASATYLGDNRIRIYNFDLDNDGVADFDLKDNYPPTAIVDGPYSLQEGEEISLNASSSLDIDGDNLQYRWDFNDDGTWDTSFSNDPTILHSWNDERSGYFTVQVSDGEFVSINSQYVTVTNVAPTATLSHDGPKGEGSPVSFNFTDQYDPGTSDTFTYSFDWNSDGLFEIENSTSDCATHTWYDNGNIAITGRIYDNDGDCSEYTASVIILNIAPNVSFIVTLPDLFVVAGENITFNGSFTDPGTLDTHNITWIFGDETSQYGNLDVIHSYSNSGTFNVTLKITDDDGGVGTYQLQVTINSTSDAISELIEYVENLNLGNGIDNSLDKKLENTQKSLDSLKNGNRSDAINKLQAFINEVEAQSGNKINEEDAAELIEYAERLIAELKS